MSSLLPDEGEFLEDGWSPDLAAEDSLVRQAVLVHAGLAVALARAVDRPWHDGPDWAGGCSTTSSVFSNWAIVKRPGLDLAAVAAEVLDLFSDGEPFVFLSPWPAAGVPAPGLHLVGHPPLMLRPAGGAGRGPTVDLDVRWATTPEDLAEVERVLVEGYPLPELDPVQPGEVYAPALLGDGATRFVLVGDADGPLATATAFSGHGLTLLEGVAALPRARGRGAGAAAAWAATTAFPDQPAVLLASDDGQPVYERMGYLRIERWTAWIRPGRP
ncbi:MAG TPA: hypothetical protein PKE56_15330 [Acidimicrobiales bacterium]|nr:hypothetical protein [Acidimicrobiales bacterium]